MPTCKTHHRQARYATYCRTSMLCGFECGRLCEFQVHGFQSCEVHMRAPRECYFLKIPLEIRFQIYGYFFLEGPVPARFGFDNICPRYIPQRTAILRTNRQIHEEATRQLYGSTNFTVEVYISGLMMCNVPEGNRKYDPRYDGTMTTIQRHAGDIGLRNHLAQRQRGLEMQRQHAAQIMINQAVQASSGVPIGLSPMISGSNHQQVLQQTYQQAAHMGVNLNIPQLQTATPQSTMQQYSQPLPQQLGIQRRLMLQQVAAQQVAAAQLAQNQYSSNIPLQMSIASPTMPNFTQQAIPMNLQQTAMQQAMVQQQQQRQQRRQQAMAQAMAQAPVVQQISYNLGRRPNCDREDSSQPPATCVRVGKVSSIIQGSVQEDSDLDPKLFWISPLSSRNFNMINSFTVEIILPCPVDIASIHLNTRHRIHPMGIMPGNVQPAGTDSHLYDYCDHIHKIVRRLRLSRRPISNLDIVIRCGSSYVGRQSWHKELVDAIELLLQPFKYLVVRNVNIREITYVYANNPLYHENSLLTELEEKDMVQKTRLNTLLTTWKQSLTSLSPPPAYPPIFSGYLQIEELVNSINKDQFHTYSKFADFPDLLHAAKVTREADNMAGFRAIWQRIVNIWFEYLGEQNRFRAKIAREINGVYAVFKQGDDDGLTGVDEVIGTIGGGESGLIIPD